MSRIVTIKALATVKLKVKLTDNDEIDDMLEILEVDDIEEWREVES